MYIAQTSSPLYDKSRTLRAKLIETGISDANIKTAYLLASTRLVNGKSSYIVPIVKTNGSLSNPGDRLLNLNDQFVPVGLSMTLAKVPTISGSPQPGNTTKHPWANPEIFKGPVANGVSEAECLNALYASSELTVKEAGNEIIYALPTSLLEFVPSFTRNYTSDRAASNPAGWGTILSVWSSKGSPAMLERFYMLNEDVVFNGQDDLKIELNILSGVTTGIEGASDGGVDATNLQGNVSTSPATSYANFVFFEFFGHIVRDGATQRNLLSNATYLNC
jgi:hypothetical protein